MHLLGRLWQERALQKHAIQVVALLREHGKAQQVIL
jgi:hypothetical protein